MGMFKNRILGRAPQMINRLYEVKNEGKFLEKDFWTPHPLSILYMDLTDSVST